MTSKADWPVSGAPVDPESTERLFFDEHQWATIEAAAARIIPTDDDPGAREARAIVFIDRYLSGIDYVFAAADGSGFLQMDGKPAEAWRERIAGMQQLYREGVAELDAIAERRAGGRFRDLTDEQQDEVLVELSGEPKPERVVLGEARPASTFLQGVSDDGLDFMHLLVLHTRQGFYGDPVYGGNRDRVGWKVIGFPGPASLADTNTCTFSIREYSVLDYDWPSLIPHMREQS
jgi:gluconate 2-dehydrogenase gamma chain